MEGKSKITLDGESLKVKDLVNLVNNPETTVEISKKSLEEIKKSHAFLTSRLEKNVVYGVNTGFGPMASHLLGNGQLLELQKNLIYSHSVGMGSPISPDFSLAAMTVRLNTLVKGYSGVSPELVAQLQKFVNLRVIPVIPEHGAVGTSGDLVQLSHIALALLGEGRVYYKGKIESTRKILKTLGIKPYVLKPKEGLSLINGTSVMSGVSSVLCDNAQKLVDLSLGAGAWALELVSAYGDSISEKLHALRPHSGQMQAARTLRELLKTSSLLRDRDVLNEKINKKDGVEIIPEVVQEVYSLRCISQVIGPVIDTLKNTSREVEIEINSVTDNPVVDWKNKKFLHGGNFHGDYVSAFIDQLKMTLVKMTMLSERRTNFFLDRKINGFLPAFANLKQPGLTLGLQGLQFVATSTTSQSQTLAFPQYVHSISTNGSNQDIVSMGTDAALLTSKVVENAFIVQTIELLTLAQATDFLKLSKKLCENSFKLYSAIREAVPAIVEDRVLTEELPKVLNLIKHF